MNYSDFIKTTVGKLDSGLVKEITELLYGGYISFYVIEKDRIGKEILEEKLCDYFEKLEIGGDKFEKCIHSYLSDIEDVVDEKIEKNQKANKKEGTPARFPRSRKYYEKALLLKDALKKEIDIDNLLDYSRIMLCLYASIINNEKKEIANFDFSSNSIDLAGIINALKREPAKIGKKSKFDIEEQYSSDRCTFIILIIMYYYIKSFESEEE